MFPVTNILKIVAGLVMVVALMYAGYSFGARKVAKLESELESIENAGKAAEKALETANAANAEMLKTKEEEHAKRLLAQQQEFDRKTKDFEAVRKGTPARIEAGQATVKASEARIAALRKQMEQASAEDKKKFQAELDAVAKDRDRAVAAVNSEKCLAMAVPDAVVALIR